MSTRNVSIKLTTQKNLIKHESAARTFGELKAELPDVPWDKMRTVERVSKNTLQMDDAVLPGGDFILFMVPEKVKSGATKQEIDVENAKYNDLRSYGSFLNNMHDAKIDLSGGTEELRGKIKDYLNTNSGSSEAEVDDALAAIEDARKKINEAIDKIIEAAKNAQPVDDTEYVVKTSIDDLDNELSEIKKALKL